MRKYSVEYDVVIEADSQDEAEAAAEHIANRTRSDNPQDIVTMEVAVVVPRSPRDAIEAAPVIDLDDNFSEGILEEH